MKNFNAGNLISLRKDIENSLKEVAEKYNITLQTGRCLYTSETFKIRLNGVIMVEGKAFSLEERDFKAQAPLYGLKSDDLDKVFTDDTGRIFKIIGLKTSSRKYPVLAVELNTGNKYKFSVKVIKIYLNKK